MRKCLVALTLLFSCINTSFALNGLGTQASPWLIQSLADFDAFVANSAYWAGHTRLDTDINLTSKTYTKAPIAPDIDNSTEGFQGTLFTGTFDGSSHTISNLTINGAHYLGLFGQIDSGSVTSLGMENVDISSTGYCVGSLCGIINGVGSITSCYTTGAVDATGNYVGGFCGSNGSHGTITQCYSTGSVDATGNFVGGLCGYNYGTITSCYAAGSVTGNDYVGGLCGRNCYEASITSCYSTVAVTGNYYVGGLCGYNGNSSTIAQCYATGIVTCTGSHIGGLCGYNYSGTITSCYSNSSVTGSYSVGGLCGIIYYGSITNCYSTGTVTGNNSVGGLLGYLGSGTVTGCFWDTQTSGTTDGVGNMNPDPTGVMGKTTTEMQDINTFLAANWDFVNLWDICDGTNYPKFIWQILAGDVSCPDGVTLVDFAIFSQSWLTSSGQPGYNDHCDLVDDNTINLADLVLFAENFLQGI